MELAELEKLVDDTRAELMAVKMSLLVAMRLVKLSLTKHGVSEEEFKRLAEESYPDAEKFAAYHPQVDDED